MVSVGVTETAERNRRLRQVAGTVGAGQNHGTGAVVDLADVELAQRIRDHRRRKVVLHRQRFLTRRVRIELRPPAGGQGHLPEILGRSAERGCTYS